MNRSQGFSWVMIGVVFCGCAAAADALPPTLRACMSETDAARRLACFDRESARLTQDSVASQSVPTPRQPDPPAVAPPPAARPAAAAPAATATTAAAAATVPSAPAQSTKDKFGFRGDIARATLDSHEAQQQERLIAKVAELSTLPHGELQLTLDNGQVWQQKAADRGMRVKVGDEVTIRHGSLNSYLLTSAAKGSMRVTRVK